MNWNNGNNWGNGGNGFSGPWDNQGMNQNNFGMVSGPGYSRMEQEGMIMDPMTGKMRKPRKPGKQEIINWFKQYTGAPELDLVDDSFDNVARHVCLGGEKVELLQKQVFNFQWEGGYIPLEYYQCPKCGKVILNRNFM